MEEGKGAVAIVSREAAAPKMKKKRGYVKTVPTRSKETKWGEGEKNCVDAHRE